MKTMKKFACLLLALVMVMSLATTAFAAGPYSITIENSVNGYVYDAYQIFVGDLSGAAENDAAAGTNAVLSNIQWGASVANAEALTTAGDTAAAVAEKLAKKELTVDELLEKIKLSTTAYKTSEDKGETYMISGLEPGYYLIQNSQVNAEGAYTEFILEVVENSTVKPKTSVPKVEKKVKDINDSADTAMSEWQDSADYDVGDDVPFQLKATLAANVSAYQGPYKVVFHDTLSAGLTFKEITKVTVGDKEITSGYTVTYSGTTLTITFDNVKAEAVGATNGSVITVEYTATLNENAVIGSAGNPNVVYLEFSNNPNWKPTEGDDTPDTGKTPEDKVIVFTYKVIVNKVRQNGTDAQGNPAYEALAGAGFTLYKFDADAATADKWVAVGSELKGAEMTTFTWDRLDDGRYKLVETTTPAGYNTIEPIYFTITAEHDVLADDPALTALTAVQTKEDGTEMAENDIIFTATANVTDGSLTSNVVNQSGTTLPETGGIGTTLFYVFGAAMVLAAVVLLVTKKRMASAE